MVYEPADTLVAAKSADEPAAFILGVADGSEDAEEVETRYCVFVPKFLLGASENLGHCEGSCDRWRQAN